MNRICLKQVLLCAISTFFVFFVLCIGNQVLAQTILLDDFESDTIREVKPGEPEPQKRYLWNQYEGDTFDPIPNAGTESTTTEDFVNGNRSLKITVTSGDIYMQFRPSVNGKILFMRELTMPSSAWALDTFNRMRFWMKVPQGVQLQGGGRNNFKFGTYVRKSDGVNLEDGGNHYYHHFDIPYTGEWHQIIVDMHPSHRRGANGNMEHGNVEYPTGESGFNYFDAMTRFYCEMDDNTLNTPVDYYFDSFEIYRETNQENVNQVYSINGVYVNSINKLFVGWERRKDENDIAHEVRYAFQDIHNIGWNAAIPAPNGLVKRLGWGGYNNMHWSSTAIDMNGNNKVFVAIKPENSNSFRQIEIPLSPDLSPSLPLSAPTNLQASPVQ